jgi:hypothetical protein
MVASGRYDIGSYWDKFEDDVIGAVADARSGSASADDVAGLVGTGATVRAAESLSSGADSVEGMVRITIHTITMRKMAAPKYSARTRPLVARSTLNWEESYEESLIIRPER